MTICSSGFEIDNVLLERSFHDNMNKGGIDSFNNYMGPDYIGYFNISGRSRDAEPLEISNFECWKDYLTDNEIPFEVFSFGHWGAGWIESIFIKYTDLTPDSQVVIVEKIKDLEAYPCFDDSHYSQTEIEHYESIDFIQCPECYEWFHESDDCYYCGDR